jgi:thiamine-phosphate pyrophosphorylase
MKRKLDLAVYLITDRDLCGARGVVDTVREAIAGRPAVVELRDPSARTGELVDQARSLAAILKPAGVTFIVSDRVDVALAADADGVHVRHADMAPADARRLIGRKRILGLSITSDADLDASRLAGVDYLVVGPTYPSLTKPDPAQPLAIGGLNEIRALTKLPIVAIGGLHAGNAADAIAAGADGVAVVSAICSAADAEAATRELREVVEAALRARA